MRGVLVAMCMVAVALGGCVETSELLSPGSTLGNTLEGYELPPCDLGAGDISWPLVDGAPKPAVPGTATIKTDAYGVSHIYADNAYDLWFANGYVQARDRLFQMDILRQVGYGESARHLGPSQLALDHEIHRELYTRDELQAQLDAAPQEGRDVLQAFADGVNRFMLEAPANNQWPAEFAAVGRVPPQWEPLDSVALIVYLIGFFGVDGGSELANLRQLGQMQSTLGTDASWDALEDWVWLRADDTYTSIHPDELIRNGCEQPAALVDSVHQLANIDAADGAVTFGGTGNPQTGLGGPSFFEPEDRGLLTGFKWGSNAMVISGDLTETGEAMMWGAPQMGYYKPPVPYQIGLHGAGIDAVGIGVTGAPGLVIGRNNDIAWTATSGVEDQVDLVEIQLIGEDSFLWDGETRAMDCWTVTHQLMPSGSGNAGPPMTTDQEVCRANGWPVVAINKIAGVAWFAKSTTRGEELMGALKWLQAPRMDGIDSFVDLMSDYPFTFNYFIASDEGIAQIHTGNVPIRAAGYDPRLPTPSGDAYAWQGEAYTEQMGLVVVNPDRGYIANWNNAPAMGWRTGDQPGLWGPVQRVQQIEYWMQDRLETTGNSFSLDDVAWVNWMAATHDSHALPFLPYLIDAAASDPLLAEMHTALEDWYELGAPWRDDDGDGRYDDPAHAIWDVMMQQMFSRITGDELGPLTKQVHAAPLQGANGGDHGFLNNQMAPLLKALRGTTNHDWCDDVHSTYHESCQEQLWAGLHEADVQLSQRFGPDVQDWLEPVHNAQFLPFGAFAGDTRPMVNRGSWVQLVSMAESELSQSVLPPGNSGLITSDEFAIATATGMEPPRLTAELDLYWTNNYKPFPLTPSEVDRETVTTQTLVIL